MGKRLVRVRLTLCGRRVDWSRSAVETSSHNERRHKTTVWITEKEQTFRKHSQKSQSQTVGDTPHASEYILLYSSMELHHCLRPHERKKPRWHLRYFFWTFIRINGEQTVTSEHEHLNDICVNCKIDFNAWFLSKECIGRHLMSWWATETSPAGQTQSIIHYSFLPFCNGT